MCEANVYIYRNGREELLMEKVDRVIPGSENSIFLESIFGERKVVQATIREMELVHHRIVLDEVREVKASSGEMEMWLEPDTDHGHFHPGEEVRLRLFKGYNMKPVLQADFSSVEVNILNNEQRERAELLPGEGAAEIKLGQELDGLVQVYAHVSGERELYAKVLVEIGHHHHHALEAIGLPLEIMPIDYTHARMGQNYEVQILQGGKPLAGVELLVTYTGTQSTTYPHRLISNEEGRARVFLSARGNYLFSVSSQNITSTFTLVKSF